MSSLPAKLQQAALYTACAAPVADIVSIAAGQILMGIALVLLVVSRTPLRVPRVWPALVLFMIGTVISDLASGDPRAGLPQIKKFYVFVVLVVVYSAVKSLRQIRTMWLFFAAAAVVNAGWAIQQYWDKVQEAAELNRDFYSFYIANRITGFQDHWMTFSGLEMMVVLAVASLLLFGVVDRRVMIAVAAACVVMLTGVVLSDTRSVWLAVGVGGCFLLAIWKPKLLALVPVVLAASYVVAPMSLKQRVTSIYRPHGTMDSNEHRKVTTITGWQMIKAHPLLGVGPQRVGAEFNSYVPTWVHRPLPSGYYGHLHSIYIHFAAERGIPTMLALICAILGALIDFIRGARHSQGLRRAILYGSAAVILGILVEGFFELNLGDSEPLALFLSILACGYVALEQPPEPIDA